MGRAKSAYDDNVRTKKLEHFPTCTYYSLQIMQQVTAKVQPRVAVQVNGTVSIDGPSLVNITFSHRKKALFGFCTSSSVKHMKIPC